MQYVADLDKMLTGFGARKTLQKMRFLSIFIQIWNFGPGSRNSVTQSGSATVWGVLGLTGGSHRGRLKSQHKVGPTRNV